MGGLLVFLLSGIIHDYINAVSLNQWSLNNTLFFAVQGGACVGQTLLEVYQELDTFTMIAKELTI
jgi:hypothetical protein